jgi:hypothetical protein
MARRLPVVVLIRGNHIWSLKPTTSEFQFILPPIKWSKDYSLIKRITVIKRHVTNYGLSHYNFDSIGSNFVGHLKTLSQKTHQMFGYLRDFEYRNKIETIYTTNTSRWAHI